MPNLIDLDKFHIESFFHCRENLSNQEAKLIIKMFEQSWVEDTPYLNTLNYWYYRYFTNKFSLYLLKYKFVPEF